MVVVEQSYVRQLVAKIAQTTPLSFSLCTCSLQICMRKEKVVMPMDMTQYLVLLLGQEPGNLFRPIPNLEKLHTPYIPKNHINQATKPFSTPGLLRYLPPTRGET